MTSVSRITAAVIGAATFVAVATFAAPAQDGQQAPAHDYVDFTVAPPQANRPLERTDPRTAGIDAAALDRMLRRAGETNTDALVVLHDGKVVGDWRFGKPAQPIEAMSAGDDGPAVEPPPLIKGYLACGARLLGPPAWDPAFGCADLPLMLSMTDIPPPYRRRFLGA